MTNLRNRVAVVTGASRGIGRACALSLATSHASLVLVSYGDLQNMSEVAESVRKTGAACISFNLDVSDYEAARHAIEEAERALGPVEILVNNAGMSQPLEILELTESDWDRTLAVNLKSVFNWTQAALPGMLTQGWGRIVNMSSISAKNGGGGPPNSVSRSAYAASKAGILGFTRGLAHEVAPVVTVNAVCPGPIQTELTASIMTGNAGEALVDRIPMKRLGRPEDVSGIVTFLVSDEAEFITGEVIDVAGGSYID